MQPTQPLPRVLLLSAHGFNHVTGTGVTLSNLFRGWPKDALACLHHDPVPFETDVCERNFFLGGGEIAKAGPFRLLQRESATAPAAVSGIGTAARTKARPPGMVRRVRDALFGADEVPETARVSAELDAFIRAFRPQLVYTLLGNNAMMRLVEAICDHYCLPLVVHVMDDWKSEKYATGLLAPPRRRAMQRLIRRLVHRASMRLGICEAMCEAYRREFGVGWLPFQNTIDAAAMRSYARPHPTVGNPVRMVYAGSILPFAQADSLADLCRVVQDLSDSGFPVTLDIYSPAFMAAAHRDRLSVGPAVRLNDPVPHGDAYFRLLTAADILALPVNFDEQSVRFIRYSMPTKVPEYLLSGVPVLAYGPESTAQIGYAAAHGWAEVVATPDPARLTDAVRRLAADDSLRVSLVEKACRMGFERHDGDTVRKAFRSCLRQASNSHSPEET